MSFNPISAPFAIRLSAWLARREFRPSFWPTLGALLLIVATVFLGNWQRHRAAEKAAMQEQFDAMRLQPPLVLNEAVIAELRTNAGELRHRYRLAKVRGEYIGRGQIYIDNRVYEGRPGFEVFTPFKLAQLPDTLLVDRGWVPRGPDRAQPPAVPAPAGTREIEGRINLPPQHYLELSSKTTEGRLWQNLDLRRFINESQLPVLPVILELAGTPGDALSRTWTAPNFGREQHLSYMVQWYSLAALTVILYFTLNWRKRKDNGP